MKSLFLPLAVLALLLPNITYASANQPKNLKAIESLHQNKSLPQFSKEKAEILKKALDS